MPFAQRCKVLQQVDGFQHAASSRQLLGSRAEVRQHFRRGTFQIRPFGNPKNSLVCHCRGCVPTVCQQAGCELHAGNISCEHTHMVQRWRERNYTRAWDAIVAGLEANHSAVRCRAHDGADGLRAEGERRKAGRNGRSGTAAGAARRVRLAGRAVRIAGGARPKVCELSGHSFAEHERARLFQAHYAGCLRTAQHLQRQPASTSRHKSVNMKNILYPKSYAKQGRPGCRVWMARFQLAGILPQALKARGLRHERMHVGLARRKLRCEVRNISRQGQRAGPQAMRQCGQAGGNVHACGAGVAASSCSAASSAAATIFW